MRHFIITLILTLPFTSVLSQNIDFKVPEHKIGISLTQLITQLEEQGEVKIFYLPEWTDEIIVNGSYTGQNIKSAIENILIGRNFQIQAIYNYGFVLLRDPKIDEIRSEIINNAEDEIPIYNFGDAKNAKWGGEVTLNGTIFSGATSEPLIGATIYANEIGKGVASDASGKYNIILPLGEHLMTIQGLNFEAQTFFVRIYESAKLDITLEENPFTLEEIVVEDNAINESFQNVTAGTTRISLEEIQKVPSMMGEADVIKSVQLLPGVNSVGEASAGFNVRGGTADQNLILLDNGIIFNPNHLFGFFSAFHPDAVKDVTFYKGSIPIQYGGKISSVLDVRQKDGNSKRLKGTGGIGLITSRLMLEGPLVKNKVSFMVAGRSSYSDWLLKRAEDEDLRQSSTFFYDFTGKISALVNKKHKLTASFYNSSDKFKLSNDTLYSWQNSSVAVNFDRTIKEGLYHISSLSAGNYSYTIEDEDPLDSFDWKYGINNFQAKSYFLWRKKNHLFTAGLDVTGYEIKRGMLKPKSTVSTIEEVKLDNEYSVITGVFISDEIQLGKFAVIPGLRLSNFALFGPFEQPQYDPNEPVNDYSITGTKSYDKNEIAKTYFGLEPRVAAKYNLNLRSNIKASVSRNFQYLHLISNTTAISPIDSWVSSNEYIKPQIGYQYSLGYFYQTDKTNISTSVEVFYKNIDNVPEYRNGANLSLKQNIETELINSKADIRGAEFSLIKEGRLSGQLSYTYSSSRRRTTTSNEALQINDNSFFPSNYDQPHNVKMNANYDISKRHVFSVNFNAATGRPISAPSERFLINNVIVTNYPERNNYRIPTYHRLDLSLLIRTNHKRDKKWEGSWTLTVYNVYNRKNAFSVFFEESKERGYTYPKAYKLSILGSVFPSVTYNFIIK
ncbi:MAG: TonB-dependent receptor [Fulvivirga sp.]